jgi:hypothetical protein
MNQSSPSAVSFSFEGTSVGALASDLSGLNLNSASKSPVQRLVLVEVNHFFSHHCALPGLLRSLREIGSFVFIPFIPMRAWSAYNPTLALVLSFYKTMGILGDPVQADPHSNHIQTAKKAVIREIDKFQGDISNLSDFEFDGLPLGAHLVEILMQQFSSARFIQTLETTSYAINMTARYIWWKDFFRNNDVAYILSSHLCYEFVIPQLAASHYNIDCLVWVDHYLLRSRNILPLPLIKTNLPLKRDADAYWRSLSESSQKDHLKEARAQLELRICGLDSTQVSRDPRMIRARDEMMREFTSETSKSAPASRKVLIFLHAFTDAPNTLPRSQFPPLYNPLISLEILVERFLSEGVRVYVKTHPSPLPADEAALADFLSKNPRCSRLDSRLTISDIKTHSFDLLITGWGSVTPEAAFAGIKVASYAPLFSPYQTYGYSHSLDLGNEFKEKLDVIIKEPFQPDLNQVIKSYLLTTLPFNLDLTYSGLASISREGPQGRYSPYAYRFWHESFNSERFKLGVKAQTSFFIEKDKTFLFNF